MSLYLLRKTIWTNATETSFLFIEEKLHKVFTCGWVKESSYRYREKICRLMNFIPRLSRMSHVNNRNLPITYLTHIKVFWKNTCKIKMSFPHFPQLSPHYVRRLFHHCSNTAVVICHLPRTLLLNDHTKAILFWGNIWDSLSVINICYSPSLALTWF